MASQKVLALREYDARKRIGETIEKAKVAGVEIGDLAPNHRFPDVGRVEELEYFDTAFQKLVAALYLPSPQFAKVPVEVSADGPTVSLTEKTAEVLLKAGIEASESLASVSSDTLKDAGLKPAQIKNVRAVFGEYVAPE